jgi:alkanesulfonate monooxygenase SsuD/methylene tetrahydromethanopterin reductase-like flavin-dependent oxidoreductase (luciferase family)
VTFEGAFHSARDARVTPQPANPALPVFVGGGVHGVRRAARHGDGYLGSPELYAAYVDELHAAGKDASSARFCSIGRTSAGVTDLWLLVAEDPEQAINEALDHILYQYNTYAVWRGTPHAERDELRRLASRWIMTPAAAIAHLREQLALAPTEAYCMMAPAGYPFDRLAEHAQLFADQVMPALA